MPRLSVSGCGAGGQPRGELYKQGGLFLVMLDHFVNVGPMTAFDVVDLLFPDLSADQRDAVGDIFERGMVEHH
jgi:hypothetical protein